MNTFSRSLKEAKGFEYEKLVEAPYFIDGGLSVDDRGVVSFVNGFDFEGVERFYVVENFASGFVRAWHGHRLERKFVFVVSGSAMIGAVPLVDIDHEYARIATCTLSARIPSVLVIPPGYFNGAKTLEPGTKIIYFGTLPLDLASGDSVRLTYNKWDIWEDDYR